MNGLQSDRTAAEELFNEVFAHWFVDGWTLIHAFRRVAKLGLGAETMIARSSAEFVRQFFADPEHANMYIGSPEKREESLSILAQAMIDSVVRNAAAGTDATAVVFAHSVLDGAAFDCCRISVLAAPQDWLVEVASNQVKLTAIGSSSYQDLVRQALEKYLGSLERDSLLVKVDRLFARCQPPAGWSPMRDYSYDGRRLVAFDDLRNDIIHGKGPRVIPGLDDELDYINRTTMFFMNYRYDLRIDPTYPMRRAQQQSPGGS